MAQFILTVTPTSPATFTTAYRTTERGRLKSVAAAAYGVDLPWGGYFIQVGTMLGGRGDDCITAFFYSGLLSQNNTMLWTGDYPFDPWEEFFVRAKGVSAILLKIIGKVEMRDP